MSRVALIVGAGPAGLTAAHELLERTDVRPLIVEADTQVGGISKTINYRGNRMDLGGHRFFSKSDWVMNWWQSILPVADGAGESISLNYQGQQRAFSSQSHASAEDERVLLVRSRLSRIFYRRRFYDYPLKLNWPTLRKLIAWPGSTLLPAPWPTVRAVVASCAAVDSWRPAVKVNPAPRRWVSTLLSASC